MVKFLRFFVSNSGAAAGGLELATVGWVFTTLLTNKLVTVANVLAIKNFLFLVRNWSRFISNNSQYFCKLVSTNPKS